MSTMTGKPRKKQSNPKSLSRWLILAGLGGIAFLAYYNSFQVPLVFDDILTIQRNASVRFGEFGYSLLDARSVLFLTFSLNSVWTGQQVWSYHLVNLLFHILNGVLLFFIAESVFKKIEVDSRRCRIYAALAAAFFLVHPIQTESVTYISSRSELLSTLFYLIGFLIFVKWREDRIGLALSLIVLVPYFFGMASKEPAVTLPATIFLYDFIFLSGGTTRPMLARWRFYALYLVGVPPAIYYILTYAVRGSIGGNLVGNLSSAHYLLTQFRVIVRYIYLVLCPIGQNLDYDFRPSLSLFEPSVLVSLALLSAIVVAAFRMRKRWPMFSFSILWFFITLAPTSSFIPVLDIIYEHRLYLPMAGLCLSFPWLIDALVTGLRARSSFKLATVPCAAVVLCLLTLGTVLRNEIWRDETKLFADGVAKSPHKERPYNLLTYAYFKKGDYPAAINTINTALQNIPEKRLDFMETLGSLYLKTGHFDEATAAFKQTLAHKEPASLASAYNDLGVSYLYKWQSLYSSPAIGTHHLLPAAWQLASGEPLSLERLTADVNSILRPAAEAFSKAVEVDHTFLSALDSFINISYDLGTAPQLETQALAVLKDRNDFNSGYTVGKIALLSRQFQRAHEFFERAEEARYDEKQVFFNDALALGLLGDKDGAVAKYLRAIRVDPMFVEAHHNVAQLYMERGDFASAIDHFAEVLHFDPNHVSANLNLARIYAAQGNKVAAKQCLDRILSVSPGNPQALQLYQTLGL